MSLFTKPIGDITLADIETFCKEGVAENVRVEYKRELSGASDRKQVAKEVSAMANTQGGVIVYGVDEERPSLKPKLPLVGMAAAPDPAARIKSICLDAIYPPIEPEVQTRALPDGRVVTVVRVHESDETPHSIEGKTEWYVRAQDICDPRPATEDELEWLRNRRSKSEKLRVSLLERCDRRFKMIPPRRSGTPELHLTCVPRFPSRELLTLDLMHAITQQAHPHPHDPFVGTEHHVVQDGAVFKRWYRDRPSDEMREYGFGQIDRLGTFAYSSSLLELTSSRRSGIILAHVIVMLHDCLSRFGSLYKLAGYWGLIDIHLHINNLRNRGLALQTQVVREVYGEMQFDDSFVYDRTIGIDDLANLHPLIARIVKELRWAFNITDKTLDDAFLSELVERTLDRRNQ